MGCFPMCVDLTDRLVVLVGRGPQICEKAERLRAFRARLVQLDTLSEEVLLQHPALVVAGDLDAHESGRTAALCTAHGVPVNVVDQPRLCTFTFPSMIVRGDLTVSVSTGGKAPAAAAYLKAQLQTLLPERTEELLDWLSGVRAQLSGHTPAQRAGLMRSITAAAFEKGAPLTPQELEALSESVRP